jgi:hypothetical protein
LASIAFPVFILVIFNVDNDVYRVFAIAVALMVVLTHQKNIGRLLKGAKAKCPSSSTATVAVSVAGSDFPDHIVTQLTTFGYND